MGEKILEVKNLTKDYGDFILNDVSFEIPRGTIMGLIGENGAGKTTTINCILNEIDRTSGTIRIFGKDNIAEEVSIKNRLGVIFDENLFPDVLTPFEVGKFMDSIYLDWQSSDYQGYLAKFELPQNKKIGEFSRGMKVKLAFAIALSHKAELLILDEATSGLDPVIREDILNILIDFVRDQNHSVLFSTHITADLEKVADYITFMHQGKIVFSHPKNDLIDKYGIVVCDSSTFESIEKGEIVSFRKQEFQYKILVRDRYKAEKCYPKAKVEPVNIDDIMLFYIRGEIK